MAVPKLRFKSFNGSYQRKKLSELLTERNEKSCITENLPLLSFTIEGGVINPDEKKTNKRDFLIKDMDTKIFAITEIDDIIYNPANLKFGAIHRNKFKKGLLSPIYGIFSCNENAAYIEYSVRRPKFIQNSNRFAEGTVVKLKTLKTKDFLQLKLNVPDKEEQNKIADFLITFDKRITNQQNIIADLEETKKGLLQKIFSQEIRFKDENGQDYPEWEKSKLLDLCDVRDGTHDTPKYVDDGYPLVTSKNLLDNGTIDLSNALKISKVDYDKINERSKVDIGDIIFGMIGTIGKPVITAFDGFAIKNVALLKKKNRQINFQYLYQYFFSTAIKKQFIINAAGGTQQFIALGTIRSLEIMCPIKAEQQKIADFLSTFDKKITAEKQILSDLQEMKKGLLQQMFV